ncbi:MAG: threonylcarbamoyl-AMP synthase [Melioribacteraceae bacterium]|nr:threonylcarbamoyl-AMP synthase [Melioribacteraceae bacterium]
MLKVEANDVNINRAVEILRRGFLVAFPTETVYGLGADGLNPLAVAKIFEAKKRPAFNPLILHVADRNMLNLIAEVNNPKVEKLIEKFWPGPLTLVLPKKAIVPDIVTAGNSTVAVRMPDHPIALKLIKAYQFPLAAPSANAFSQLSPTTAQHVVNQLGENVNFILDGGSCSVGVESTILKITDDEVVLLRPGGLPIEEIEKVIGKVVIKEIHDELPIAPGMLPFHYSPNTTFKLINEINPDELDGKKVGAIFLKENSTGRNFEVEKILSKSGDLPEAAANLFGFLHELEELDLDIIIAETVEEEGLGRAIMDRLRKAAKRYE